MLCIVLQILTTARPILVSMVTALISRTRTHVNAIVVTVATYVNTVCAKTSE